MTSSKCEKRTSNGFTTMTMMTTYITLNLTTHKNAYLVPVTVCSSYRFYLSIYYNAEQLYVYCVIHIE